MHTKRWWNVYVVVVARECPKTDRFWCTELPNELSHSEKNFIAIAFAIDISPRCSYWYVSGQQQVRAHTRTRTTQTHTYVRTEQERVHFMATLNTRGSFVHTHAHTH